MKKGIAIFGILLFLMLATTQIASAGPLPLGPDGQIVVSPHHDDLIEELESLIPPYDWFEEEDMRWCHEFLIWGYVSLAMAHMHVVI